MNNGRIRITDIAKKAGVSTGTVDRVIHSRGSVSQKKMDAVQRALAELNYTPNIIARTLAQNRLFKIGVLIPKSVDEPYWDSQAFGIARGLKEVEHYGVTTVPCQYDLNSPESFIREGSKVVNSKVDGMIIAPIFRDEGIQIIGQCEQMKIPYVLINTELPYSETGCYVGQDSYRSGVVAAKLLDQLMNPDEIALLLNMETAGENAEHFVKKKNGFQNYFIENPRKVLVKNLSDYKSMTGLNSVMSALFRQYSQIGGIFVTSSRIYQVIDALKGLEYKNISAVGYDLIKPNIACLESGKVQYLINQNPQLQGYRAMRLIVDHIVLGKKMKQTTFIPFDIVIKENLEYYLNSNNPFDDIAL